MFSLTVPWQEALLTASVLLVAGIDDLRSRKIHNKLILALLPLVLIALLFIRGPLGLLPAFTGMLAALVLGLPLTFLKVIGGGDFKLLIVFGMTLNAAAVFYSFLCTLPWALGLGLLKMALDKNLKDFAKNLKSLSRMKNPDHKNLHSIPFSIALIFGWLTFITLKNMKVF